MPISWDAVGDRRFETGIDRGVFYPPGGTPVAWNGLTSVTEKAGAVRSAVYYEGSKVNDIVYPGDFQGALKAITYPEILDEYVGLAPMVDGFFVGDQMPKAFDICYRTLIGNDTEGIDHGYKIHLLYNITATPSDIDHSTMADQVSPIEFQWDISAVPEEVVGFRPSAHFVIDSTTLHPLLLSEIETILYGSDTVDPSIPPIDDLVEFMTSWLTLEIIDHGDGTWSAVTAYEGYITMVSDTEFQLHDVDAVYLDEDTYEVSSTN